MLFFFSNLPHELTQRNDRMETIFFSSCLDCPGTQSEDAGKVSACAGCPNQNICASGVAKGPDLGNFFGITESNNSY